MLQLTSQQLRAKWLSFFEKHDHYCLEPQSLLPHNDPSLLFINSGVATLKPYFAGTIRPPALRIVNVQKVLRTNDVENVGKTARHQTLFEMMGNFSIGDYFKKDAINFAYQFLVNELKIDPALLYITYYQADQEVYQYWRALGISDDHLLACDKDRNFWDMGFGPCGSCSEIFYDRGSQYDPQSQGLELFYQDLENDRYLEIWNIVFSEFHNDGQGNYVPLFQKNIDTGAGLERLLAISQNVPTNFDTDLFQDIIKAISVNCLHQYDINNYFNHDREQQKINEIYRIIADHLRAVVLTIADGCLFDNKGQGSVIRKLMRRVCGLSQILNLDSNFLHWGIDAVINSLGGYYGNLVKQKEKIFLLMTHEYQLFNQTLTKAWRYLDQLIAAHGLQLPAHGVFKLVETYGFPKELLDEILERKNLTYDHNEYLTHFHHHQAISKHHQAHLVMGAQNEQLLQFQLPSTFDYQAHELTSEVIGLFDEHWNVVNQLTNQPGYVILKSTCIYALGGGQEADHGEINGYYVSDVFKGPNQQNVHFLPDVTIKLHETVSVRHDQKRRAQLSRMHSAEHLLHAALKRTINQNIKQEGAYKGEHKITLDFRYHEKLSEGAILGLEAYVDHKIKQQISVVTELTTLEAAKALGANAYFEEKYQQQQGLLRLVRISDESIELCGGTHVANTAAIETFLIISCKSIAAGAWRIEAVAGTTMVNHFLAEEFSKMSELIEHKQKQLLAINEHSQADIEKYTSGWKHELNVTNWRSNKKVVQSFSEFVQQQQKQHEQSQTEALIENLHLQALNNPNKHLVHHVVVSDWVAKTIISATNSFCNELNDYLCVVFNQTPSSQQYYLCASKSFWQHHNTSAKACVAVINEQFHGKGGGRVEIAQGSYAAEFSVNDIINCLQQLLKQ